MVILTKRINDPRIKLGTMARHYIKETTIEYLESNPKVDAVLVMVHGLEAIDVNITDEEYELCCKQTTSKLDM